MNYAEIKYADIANGIGVRTSLFVSGCAHHCPGCFNEVAWDYQYGNPFTQDTINDILNSIKPNYIHGLSLLGGEPLDPKNQAPLRELIEQFKAVYPDKTIWCYTGYVFPQDFLPNGRAYTKDTAAFLSGIDVLVDGPWMQDLADITIQFRGSKNQRIIDVPASIKANQVIELDYERKTNYRR